MHMNFGTLLFCVSIYVSVPEVHSAGSTTTCFTLTNTTTSHYFHAFDALKRSNKHKYGCASNGNVEASATTKVYQENHIIDVENDLAADIYLNINGIHHRTTNSLPQYEKYRYEFALLSEKDVIWLVSLGNLPNSNVSFKFYFSPGSHIISRDGHQFPSVRAGVERKYMSAQAFLNMYKKDLFQGKELTSFSQIISPQIAAVNISVGPKQDPISPSNGNFTAGCNKAGKNYLSPIVSVAKYQSNLPSFNCESRKAPHKEPNLGRAYIVDVKAQNLQDERLRQVVNLEVVGKEASHSNNDAILKTIVVLRSNMFTVWRVNIARELRPTTVKFVIGHGDEISGVSSTEIMRENLDYDENDYTTLTRSIETRHRCSLASYVQYDTPVDLIFLSLSESEDQLGPAKFDRDSLTDKANDIVRQSEIKCGNDDWSLNVPISVLNQYDLSSNNLEVGDDCSLMDFGVSVMYMMMDCNSIDDKGIAKTELKVTFRTQGKHLFPSPVKETETISISLQCNPRQVNSNIPLIPDVRMPETDDVEHVFNFSATCDMDVFFVEITDKDAELLNVTAIAECESARINGYKEYTFRKDFERSCGATFEDGIFRIRIPRKILDDGVLQEPKEIPCKPQIVKVTTSYDLQIFKDFNLRNLFSYGPILVQPDQQNTDETTFHIKVSLITNDPLLTVYLSSCSLKHDSKVVQRLIINNCPASNIVSFVRRLPASGNHAQHFAVKIARFFPHYERLRIECDVTACCTTDLCGDRVITAPKCFHLHGDSCSQGDTEIPFKLASYHPDIVMSPIFRTAAKNTTYGTGDGSVVRVNYTREKNTSIIGTPLLVILAFGAFFLGCIFVGFIWLIDARYKHRNSLKKRKSTKSESESGSSASTGSTKTTGSSFNSLFCLKTGKSSSPSSSPTASKDNLELKPFIPSSTSTDQPQNTLIRSKKMMGSETRTNPTSCRANGNSVLLSLNTSLEHGMTACSKSQDTELSSQPSVLVINDALRTVDEAFSIPRSEPPSWQTSSERTHLQFANTASAAQTKTPQDTSLQPRQWNHNGHRSTSIGLKDDCRLNSCPVQVNQDEFARLKEEAV